MLTRLRNTEIKYLLIIALVLFIPILLLPGKSSKQNENGNVEKELTAEDFEPESYNLIEQSEELVDDFPDIPQYPNSDVVISRSYDEEGGKGYFLELTSRDSIMEIIDWYENELVNNGWVKVLESERNIGDPTNFFIELKKPDIQLDVNAIRLDNGATKVIITHHYNMGEYGPPAKYE